MGSVGTLLRKLRARIIPEPTAFGWVIDGRLAASGALSSQEQVSWVARRDIGSILSLTEAAPPDEWTKGTGIASTKHIPLPDHAVPSIRVLNEAVAYIDNELKSGRVVLVHCLAGKGRTGCVLAAYLMKSEGITAERAMEAVRAKRPGSIEARQEKALREFGEQLRSPIP